MQYLLPILLLLNCVAQATELRSGYTDPFSLIRNPRLVSKYHTLQLSCSPSLLLDCIRADYGNQKFRTRYTILPKLAPILVKLGINTCEKVEEGEFAGCNYEELINQLIGSAKFDEPLILRNTLESIKKADAEAIDIKTKRKAIVASVLNENVAYIIDGYEGPNCLTDEECEQFNKDLDLMESQKNSRFGIDLGPIFLYGPNKLLLSSPSAQLAQMLPLTDTAS